MSLLVQALLVAAFVTIAFIDSHTAQTHIFRPIVVGPVVGLIMGDVATGFTVGVQVEMMFLAVIFVIYITRTDRSQVSRIPVIKSLHRHNVLTLDKAGNTVFRIRAAYSHYIFQECQKPEVGAGKETDRPCIPHPTTTSSQLQSCHFTRGEQRARSNVASAAVAFLLQ